MATISERDETIQLYIDRDIKMNLNNNEQLRFSINKLSIQDKETCLKNMLINILNKTKIINMDNFIDTVTNIINSQEYIKFSESIDEKINRSNELQQFINDIDSTNFYNFLTYDELLYLGY